MTQVVFNDPNDFKQGGEVHGDFGENRYTWSWDEGTNTVTVGNSIYSRSQELPGKLDGLAHDDAKERIAAVVRDFYADLLENPPIK